MKSMKPGNYVCIFIEIIGFSSGAKQVNEILSTGNLNENIESSVKGCNRRERD
jgi:hypothetical protein